MRIDPRLLGWGVFFILLGAIPLAARAQLLSRDLLGDWWLLWPILLIGWGLGLVLTRTPIAWIGGAVTAITFGIMGGSAIATGFHAVQGGPGCGGGQGTAFDSRTGDFGASAQATIEFSCGTLTVGTAAGNGWSVAGTERDGRVPSITADIGRLEVRSPEGGGLDGGRTTWNVALPRNPSMALGLTLNAGSGTVDLAGANIASASITVNAGSITADLSAVAQVGDVNATANAGSIALSLPAGARSANLSLNAGSLDVCVAVGAQVEVAWSGTLGSNNLDDLGFTEHDDDRWRSPGFNPQAAFTKLNVQATAGSFELQLGGTCRA